jgi:hypothetical protein
MERTVSGPIRSASRAWPRVGDAGAHWPGADDSDMSDLGVWHARLAYPGPDPLCKRGISGGLR